MHFSPLLFSVGALAATFTANPAPAQLTEALPALDAGTAELGRDALSGNLPKNLAKIWIFSNLNCDQNNGPAWNIYVLPGEDRCIPYQNVGSIFAWYESDIGHCTTTIHSGSNCRGSSMTPYNKMCTSELFASLSVSCPRV